MSVRTRHDINTDWFRICAADRNKILDWLILNGITWADGAVSVKLTNEGEVELKRYVRNEDGQYAYVGDDAVVETVRVRVAYPPPACFFDPRFATTV